MENLVMYKVINNLMNNKEIMIRKNEIMNQSVVCSNDVRKLCSTCMITCLMS